MSARSQKSARWRLVNLRARAANSISGWDDTLPTERNAVFVPCEDVEAGLERVEECLQRVQLAKLEHMFLDGGVLVRFRRKRDANRFQMMLAVMDSDQQS